MLLAPIISAVGSRATNGDGAQSERGNGTDSGQSRDLPGGNIMATAVPPMPAVISVSSMPQPGMALQIYVPNNLLLGTKSFLQTKSFLLTLVTFTFQLADNDTLWQYTF